MEPICLTCGNRLRGRSDKKFCDYGCKNNYHNNLNADERNFRRREIYALRKQHALSVVREKEASYPEQNKPGKAAVTS